MAEQLLQVLPINPTAAPEDVGLDAARLARISAWMRGYVDGGKLAGALVQVARRDQVVFTDWCGVQDIDTAVPMTPDTIVRIYSMTKPITTVAALMLYEEGHFQLDAPVSKFIPALGGLSVFVAGDASNPTLVASERDFTVRELMNHTSGLSYGFMEATPVDELYREHSVDFQTADVPLAALVAKLGELPLLAQPGTQWNYSVSTDVLGHLVEIWSGRDLASFLQERIFAKLGMHDTGFHVPQDKVARFASNYRRRSNGELGLIDAAAHSRYLQPAVTYSGGGGLVSTVADYMRFARLLARRGELDGQRVLSRKTVELMSCNHLPGDMAAMGQPRFSESSYEGIGFGLGVSVMLDPARAQVVGSPGEFAWGGAASTAFWVDPVEEQIVILLTQLMPSSQYPLRRELRVLSYQAIVD
ncbi:MAG: serine hydrolase [Gammaproteobacteria bacterium]|nr:serine hydrolase [Gammaproteobacteria bacterium]